MKISVTKRFRFESAHQLFHPDLSPEENQALFHQCYRQHGHSYQLYVTVEGTPDPVSGFVVDFKELKRIVQEEIVSGFDHYNLNEDVPFFRNRRNVTTTVENLLVYVSARLLRRFEGLREVRIYETEDSFATLVVTPENRLELSMMKDA